MIDNISSFDTSFGLADRIELYVLTESESLSKSKLTDLIRDKDGDKEELIDSIFLELARRQKLLGESSPFELQRNIIRRKIRRWGDIPEYIMCLIFSVQGVKKIEGDDDGTKLFERLSKEAISFYVGGDGKILGFPNNLRFQDQVRELAVLTNEQLGGRIPLATDKDKGVDIVAWKPHGDLRGNQIVLLIQAAAGFHWGLKKRISLEAWSEFIFWEARPLIGIIVPVVISQDKWISSRDDYQMLFDRIRIQRLLYNKELSDTKLKGEIKEWCKKELN